LKILNLVYKYPYI